MPRIRYYLPLWRFYIKFIFRTRYIQLYALQQGEFGGEKLKPKTFRRGCSPIEKAVKRSRQDQ